MLVTSRQMQEAEERAFAAGSTPAELMEKAGAGIANVVRQFFPRPGTLVLYLGSGNNAGDALVAARHLSEAGWSVCARLGTAVERMKELPQRHLNGLPGLTVLAEAGRLLPRRGALVLLDGLLGIGSRGEMRPNLRALAGEMNALRHSHHARIVAMDIPSGLDPDTGEPGPDTVRADITAAVGQVKAGLVADAATSFVGRIALVPVQALAACEGDASAVVLTSEVVRSFRSARPYEMHKGQAGRVGIMAGSRGFLGAASLVALGALRAGAGLVTLLVKEETYPLLANCVPPEVMVKPVSDYREALAMHFDAIAVGPGLGFDAEAEVMEVILKATPPLVVDADALTILSKIGVDRLAEAQGPRLLTPHPGEMQRLVLNTPEELSRIPRRALAETLAAALPGHVVLYKGARTVIAADGQPTLFNSTGHPGMATGGMGDFLTGACAALAGQGIDLLPAAGMGAWLCGRSAEIAALDQAQESVLPTDVAAQFGRAWKDAIEGAA